MARFTPRALGWLMAGGALALPLAATAQSAPSAPADPLAQAFQDPPPSARPRAWWHWMNGNITIDGIDKDLAWMHDVGLGGVQTFDVNLMTPQIVEKRLAYMTPEWKAAFAHAAKTADRLGLELGIASSPGWSETGGPWVKAEDGLKKVVWSEALVAPGQRLKGPLASPPSITGAFQSLPQQPGMGEVIKPNGPHAYGDIAVLAVPETITAPALPAEASANGQKVDAALLQGGDLAQGVNITPGTDAAPASVVYRYAAPVTVRAASLYINGARAMFSGSNVVPTLEASDDGANWRQIAELTADLVPTTRAFAPVTARNFRLVLKARPPMMSNADTAAPGVAPPPMFASVAPTVWNLRQFALSTEPVVDHFETKAGFAMALDYFALPGMADGASGAAPAQVVNLTDRLKPDGTLDWVAPRLPAGQRWRVIRLGWSLLGTTNHPASEEATGLEVDKFDADAVRRYMTHYLAMYEDAAGPGMLGQHGVRALVTDSIEVGAANWTPHLLAEFKARRGYDATPWLPALTGTLVGSREQADRFLYDWRRTLGELISSAHYGTIAEMAHQHGLTLYGEALEDKRPSLGDDMTMRSHTDVPMAALWTFPRTGAPNPSYVADIKGAASVAHIYGQNLVAAESMTSMLNYWADSPQTLKHVIDLEFVTGVNRPVVHTSVHQPVDDKQPGLSLLVFGQFFNRHEAWAPLARAWVDYMARNSVLLQAGRNEADVGYVYGEEAPLTGLYGEKPVADAPTTHAYDFVSVDALTQALHNEGEDVVSVGGARYKALYLGGSSRQMTLATLTRLAALVEGGARVVGLAPQGNPSLADDPAAYAALVKRLWPGSEDAQVGKGRVVATSDIEAGLARLGIASDFRVTGGAADTNIAFLHRHLADGDSWFLVNRKDRPETVEAHFRVTGKAPELWHAETGAHEPVSYRIENGETVVPLALGPEESVHVVFRKAAVAPSLAIKKLVPVPVATLGGAWDVAFQPGRGAPASVRLPELAPLQANANPGIRYFAGMATYTKDFAAPKGWRAGQPLWLDLGQVAEIAEVRLNGQSLGTVWHSPFRLDMRGAMKSGQNHLEVRVGNLWVNRLIGDAQPGATKVAWTAQPTYTPQAPLRPSGLIGPVVIEGQSGAANGEHTGQ